MYKPRYEIPLEGAVNPRELLGRNAPNVRVNMYVSPYWQGKSAAELNEIAGRILDNYRAELNRFVDMGRQSIALSTAPSNYMRREVPGMSMRSYNSTKDDILGIDLFPDAAPAGVIPIIGKQKFQFGGGGRLEVGFDNYPVPGAQTWEDPPIKWDRSGQTVNFADPTFAPLNNAGDDPILAPGGTSPISGGGGQNQHTWTGEDAFNPVDQDGYVEEMWLKNKVGGTLIWPKLIEGKRYWEVEVLALPSDVPTGVLDDEAVPELQYGAYSNSPIKDYLDTTGTTIKWPEELNTFLSPIIGLAPAYFLNTPLGENNFTHYILGLDPDLDAPRSIGAVRTSSMEGPTSYGYFRRGYYALDNQYHLPVLGVPVGEEGFIASLNLVTEPAGNEVPDVNTPLPSGSLNEVTGDGNTLFKVMTSSPVLGAPWGGPTEADGIPSPLVELSGGASYWKGFFDQGHGGARWAATGHVGGPVHNHSGFAGIQPEPFVGTTIIRYEHAIIDVNGEVMTYGDFVFTGATSATGMVFIPWDATLGVHCPVIKGRYDFIGTLRDPAETPYAEGSYMASSKTGDVDLEDGKSERGTGSDTGVDLGELAVGDTVMMAADQDTGKVWFGKNGAWLAPQGGLDGTQHEEPDPAAGEGPTTLMDAATGGKPEYYAAMSYRIGPVTMQLKAFGGKYAPPGGFKWLDENELEYEYPDGYKNED